MNVPQPTGSAARLLPDGLLRALTRTYAQVLGRQGRTTTPFVRWSKVTNRAHDFTWLGGMRILERVEQDRFMALERRPTLGFADAPLLVWRAALWRGTQS